MFVIGTAGHVDHGKSTLISALTGINPDRLKEEQERQMTIDLGFAWYMLPSGEEIGIVDVPGHSDFIENMLAGVGGIDGVLFVIAADEGIMPQSREHLDILNLLGVSKGLIVLTKIDLVEDSEWIDMVEAEINELVRNSFLENAPIVKVSSKSGIGLIDLKKKIESTLAKGEVKRNIQVPRLPIDRIFSLKGFGTIVTGTLLDGSLSVGEQVEVLPSFVTARIRGLQNHKKKQEKAEPGTRTAINLTGVEVSQLKRGDVVCLPGSYTPTQMIDAEVELLGHASANIKHDDHLKLFTGASQTSSRVRIIGKNEIYPGENGWVQLILEKPIVVRRNDRFILRRPSPAATIGGGFFIDPHPEKKHKRFSPETTKRFKAKSHGSIEEEILLQLTDLRMATLSQVIDHSDLSKADIQKTLQNMQIEGAVIVFEDPGILQDSSWIIAKNFWVTISQKLLEIIRDFHQKNPLLIGMRIEDCANQVSLSRKQLLKLAEKLQSDQILVISDSRLKTIDHKIMFKSDQKKAVNKLEALFNKNPNKTPSVDECIEIVGKDVYSALIELGDHIEISKNIVFRAADIEGIIQQTRQLLQNRKKITVAEFRDHFSTSRKYAVSLLEYMDKVGITTRLNDYRILKSS